VRESLDEALRAYLEHGDLAPLAACAEEVTPREAAQALRALISFGALRAAAGHAPDPAARDSVVTTLRRIAGELGALSREELAGLDPGEQDAELRARLEAPLDLDPQVFVASDRAAAGLRALQARLGLDLAPELEVRADDLELGDGGGKVLRFPSAKDAQADEWALAAGEPEPDDDDGD